MNEQKQAFDEGAIFNQGQAYFHQGKYDLALQQFHLILRHGPENDTALTSSGYVWTKKKEYRKGMQFFRKALKVNPQNADAYTGIGCNYFEQGNINDALDNLLHALKLDPGNKFADYLIGLCYFELKDYSRARDYFNKSLAVYPHKLEVHQMLAQVYLQENQLSSCLEEMAVIQGLTKDATNAISIQTLAAVYMKQKKFAQAAEQLENVLALDPGNRSAHFELGLCYIEQKKYAEGITFLKKSLTFYPQRLEIHQMLAQSYLEESQLRQCLKELAQVKKLSKDNTNVSYHQTLAAVYMKQKEYALAAEQLEKILGLDPDNQPAHLELRRCYLELKDYDRAVDMLLASEAKRQQTEQDSRLVRHEGKIKIIRIPNFYGTEILSCEMNSILLPPLALGSIVSYLRAHGITVEQDDLHIKVHHDNYFSLHSEDKIEEALFLDEQRVRGYVNGNRDQQIEEAMIRTAHKTALLDYTILLFSLDTCSANTSHIMFALCLAHYLKQKYRPIIILGGANYFPSLMQKMQHDWKDIDYVICNEGEEVITELIKKVSTLSYSDSRSAEGRENRVLSVEKVPAAQKPDFDGLPLELYKYKGLKTDYCADRVLRDILETFNQSGVLLLPLRFIKGCTNRCIFCASSVGGLVNVINPAKVVQWLEDLQKKYNPTGYLFLNDTLNISTRYLNQLCDEIIKRKLKILWSDCVRVDRLDEDLIGKMRQAGCMRMVFGMETASKKLLQYINKEINLEYLEKMLYCADQAGIWTGVEIICGLPYEQDSDVQETIRFLKKNKQCIDTFYYNAFNIKDTSLLQVHPEQYGISNIAEICNYEEKFSTFIRYRFDEISGLRWEEKRQQILENFCGVMGAFGEPPFPDYEYEHFLFFLYSHYVDKNKIREIFNAIGEQKMNYVRLLRNNAHNAVDNKITQLKTFGYGKL